MGNIQASEKSYVRAAGGPAVSSDVAGFSINSGSYIYRPIFGFKNTEASDWLADKTVRFNVATVSISLTLLFGQPAGGALLMGVSTAKVQLP